MLRIQVAPESAQQTAGGGGSSHQSDWKLQTFVALETHPAFQASFVAILIAGVVSKEVVPRSAKLVAAKAIIMLIARDSNLVFEVSNAHVLFQGLPLPAGVDHARVRSFFDNVITTFSRGGKSERGGKGSYTLAAL